MSGIKGKNTMPERIVRSGLHRLGFRFRLHARDIPGKPDLVLPKYRAVIFVNGCFWHGHDCHLFSWPSTRNKFWSEKILRNQARDAAASLALTALGWRKATIWECAVKGRERVPAEQVAERIARWLGSNSSKFELRGKAH